MSKIDVSSIIRNHLATLVDCRNNRRSNADLLLFFGLPALLSGFAVYFGWAFSVYALNAVLAAFAIFAGLLLNLLLLVYTFSADSKYPSTLEKVRDLHNNIAYAVLISIVIVFLALFGVIRLKAHEGVTEPQTGPYLSFLLVYFTCNFVLTLLMILKRIHTMMNEKLDPQSLRKAS